jgi:hypothetical protein
VITRISIWLIRTRTFVGRSAHVDREALDRRQLAALREARSGSTRVGLDGTAATCGAKTAFNRALNGRIWRRRQVGRCDPQPRLVGSSRAHRLARLCSTPTTTVTQARQRLSTFTTDRQLPGGLYLTDRAFSSAASVSSTVSSGVV